MTHRTTPAAAALAALLALAAPAAAQDEAARAAPDDAQGDVQDAQDAGTAVVVLEFSAPEARAGDLVATAAEMARAPFVARIEVAGSGADRDGASGTLVFQDLDRFLDWRGRDMAAFFEPLGGLDAVSRTVRVDRPGLLARTQGGTAHGARIAYVNRDNDAAGDADIDAVTVLCSGDADCKPSN